MRKVVIGLSVAVVAVALLVGAAVAARPNQSWHFVTPLSGAEEVPANDSLGRGVAIFHLSADGESLSYRLIVANIENVTQAHIHAHAPAGANAGVVVWLYPEDGPPAELILGRSDGVLATGTITEDDLVGAFAGQPLSTLIDAITGGTAYVNVHTTQFPPGEIRGQLD